MAEPMNMPSGMKLQSAGYWHLIAGILMIILGLYILFNPVASLIGLALYIGVVFIVVGSGYFVASFSYHSSWYLVVGLLDILVGIVFVSNLGIGAASLPVIFAMWCMAVGIIQLISSFAIKKMGFPWIWTLSSGIVGVLVSLLILAYPGIGVIAITSLMGMYVILYGVFAIVEYMYSPK